MLRHRLPKTINNLQNPWMILVHPTSALAPMNPINTATMIAKTAMPDQSRPAGGASGISAGATSPVAGSSGVELSAEAAIMTIMIKNAVSARNGILIKPNQSM